MFLGPSPFPLMLTITHKFSNRWPSLSRLRRETGTSKEACATKDWLMQLLSDLGVLLRL
jgi:hypothetical protein